MFQPAFHVREAVPEDAPRIAMLYAELVGGSDIAVLPDQLAAVLNDSRSAVFVAECEGLVRGTALVNLCADVMFRSQPFAVIENVIVEKSYQGRGMGAVLLRHIEQFCSAKDCSKMMLLSASGREAAHRFFERAGFLGSVKRGFVKYRRSFAAIPS